MSDSDDDDDDYLLWCAVSANKPEDVKRLIERGGNVNYEYTFNAYSPTPLLMALGGNLRSPSCARILIEAKVDLGNLRKRNVSEPPTAFHPASLLSMPVSFVVARGAEKPP